MDQERSQDSTIAQGAELRLAASESVRRGGQSCASKFVIVPETLQSSVDETKVEYRQLGKSGLRISNPILGGLSIGDPSWFSWIVDEAQALPLLKHAYDRGINTWDTANIYSNGESERIMGEALRVYNIPRRKVVLMTKVYRVVCDDEHPDPGSGVSMHTDLADQSKDYVNQWGLSRSAIFNAVDASLCRLGTTYIDVLQIHRYDSTVAPEETMEALHDLVKSGKVRYIGASSMWCYQFARLQDIAERRGWTKFISMQNYYNLLYREEEREMLKYCHETGVGIIPWSPLASGQLARPPSETGSTIRSTVNPNGGSFYAAEAVPSALYLLSDSSGRGGSTSSCGSDTSSGREDSSAPLSCSSALSTQSAAGLPFSLTSRSEAVIIERVQKLAARKGWPMSHVALAWLNARVTAPIVGFSTEARIDEALGARGKSLTKEEEEWLEEPYVSRGVLGHE